jgi:hypothetical protein
MRHQTAMPGMRSVIISLSFFQYRAIFTKKIFKAFQGRLIKKRPPLIRNEVERVYCRLLDMIRGWQERNGGE